MVSRAPALYPRLLGAAWEGLPEPVRACHLAEEGLRAWGLFRVENGRSWLAWLIIRVMGMPRAGEGVLTRLSVERREEHDEWRRDFGGREVVTTQRVRAGGQMAERFGPIECVFAVRAEPRALVYAQVGAELLLGPLRLRLPSWMSPRVEGRAWAEPGERSMRVEIRMSGPLVGFLVAYGGRLSVGEEPS